jgi:hypothetical protein
MNIDHSKETLTEALDITDERANKLISDLTEKVNLSSETGKLTNQFEQADKLAENKEELIFLVFQIGVNVGRHSN